MKNIIVFTSPTWPHCTTAKHFLRDQGFKYIEKDVSKDPSAQQDMMKLGIRGVPAFIIGDDVIVGLDTQKIISALDYSVIKCPHCGIKTRVPKNKGTIKITCKKCNNQFQIKT